MLSYRLELSDPKHHRRLMWDAVPKSIHEGISSAFDECLMFGSSVAQVLWLPVSTNHEDEDGRLAYLGFESVCEVTNKLMIFFS